MKNLIVSIVTCLYILSCNNRIDKNYTASTNEEHSESPDIKFLKEQIEISNSLNGIELLQRNIDFTDRKYTIELLVETYENDVLIEEKTVFSGRSYHQLDSLHTDYINQLILAVKREGSNNGHFTFIFGNNINKVSNQISIDQKFLRPFGLKDFEISEDFELNKSIPFALYGAFWEFDFNGTTAMRFCSTDEKLKSRTDDQVYGKSPFYYIFSFRLT